MYRDLFACKQMHQNGVEKGAYALPVVASTPQPKDLSNSIFSTTLDSQ